MRKVVLFIAMSLDGFIADAHGGVDWLSGQDGEKEDAGAYSQFVQTVDTVVMGWNTYHQIVTELSPGQWVYRDLTSYVVTHRDPPAAQGIVFTREDPCALVDRLRHGQGSGIWICGGAELVRQLMEAELIDEYCISVIPTILGSGIRLFGSLPKEARLRLIRSRTYDGIVELVYLRR